MKKSYIQPSIVTILAVGGQILSGSINVNNGSGAEVRG